MSFELGGADALLIVGASEHLADLYYATRFRAPDSFVFIWTAKEKMLLVSNLELDRARQQAEVDRVLAYPHYEQQARHAGCNKPSTNDVLRALLSDLELQHLLVPGDFPLGTGDFLRAAGLHLAVAPSPLFPQRQIKTADEIKAIHRAQQAAEAGMAAAVTLLGEACVVDGVLEHGGQVLTSERVRRAIHLALMERDCTGQHTIVAGGEQGCDPHQEGYGPLRAGEPIIIDIFPKDDHSSYFGDITRTFVKGQVAPAVHRLYETVLQAQEMALERIRVGADGRAIHDAIVQFFSDSGYETGEKDGYMQGYFHGTGHGLGLEIHEGPSIGKHGTTLEENQVVTVEPGLYYRGLGGVRIEDTVVVREEGYENLTTFPKELTTFPSSTRGN
jgi:Xaa-Pro aminopeptidase